MNQKPKITIIIIEIVLTLAVIGGFFFYKSFFGAPQKQAEAERFIVPLGAETKNTIQKLYDQGFIKNEWALNFALKGKNIEPGGYKISKSMTTWQMAKSFKEPYMKWVVIPEGFRKEQIAELVGDSLEWNDQTKKEWITKYTAMNYDYVEGVYFPDTYLIPKDEAPLQVAQRLINKFNEKFQPYADKFVKSDVKWTTALKLASIVQREAAGKDDMPLIAGILWNRLLKEMKLDVDATVQYVRDDQIHYGEARYDKQPLNYVGEGAWWTPIKTADKDIASPYNTYRNKGLPPHPICNPGLDAIDAALNPVRTECLYYLHDSDGQIHCAKTYEEHQINIENYLK